MSLKNDRVAQVLLAAVVIVALFFLFLVGRLGWYLSQRPAAPTVAVTPIVYQLIGENDDVVFFDCPGSGQALFTLIHRGDSNFIVNLSDANGQFVDQLANEIGPYDGEKTARLEQGRYSLAVDASGPWAVVVLPPQ